MKSIQIGDVFGELEKVEMEDNQTVADALQAVNMSISNAQRIIASSTSRAVNMTDTLMDNEVYVLTSNQESGL